MNLARCLVSVKNVERKKKLILCIDADRETAALIAEGLVDRGFAVEVAHDGREGLASILRLVPDLVLCEIVMPFLSGFDVLKRRNELAPGFAHMPFVFLTALSDRENELEGRRLGADDYVTKPVDFDILAAIINTRIAHSPRNEHWPQPVGLSQRETETLTWAARGKTSAEIGQILGISKRTVDFHIDNARIKLGVATRTQAVLKAANGGMIEP